MRKDTNFKTKYPRLYQKILSRFCGREYVLDAVAGAYLYLNKIQHPTCEICHTKVCITKKFRKPVSKVRCKKHINTNNIVSTNTLLSFSNASEIKVKSFPDKPLTKTDQIKLECLKHGEYIQSIGYYLNGGQCQKCYHEQRIGGKRQPHTSETRKKLANAKKGKKLQLSNEAKQRKTNAQKAAWQKRKEDVLNYKKYTNKLSATRKEYIKQNGFTFPNREKTSLEQKFEQFLIANNLSFESQFVFHNKKYDFYIPMLDLLVEVDGEYWHRRPSSIKNDVEKHTICLQEKQNLVRISSENFIPEIIFKNKHERDMHNKQILERRGIYGLY